MNILVKNLALSLITISLVIYSDQTIADDLLFSPFKDSTQKKVYLRHWDRYPLIIGKDKKIFETLILKGKINRIYYDIPKSYSEENILNNYIVDIKNKGGEILYLCKGEVECGTTKEIQKIIQPLSTVSKNNPHLVVAKISVGKRNIYASVYVRSWKDVNNLQLDWVEPMDEPLDLVKLNLSTLESVPSEVELKPLSINRDIKNSADHPLLSRLPGSIISKYKLFGYEKNLIVNSINKGEFNKLEIKGKTTMIGYNVPREYSEFEVIENYKIALKKAGFKTLYFCEDTSCGNSRKLAKAIDALVSVNANKSQYYLVSELDRPQGKVLASIFVTGFINGLRVNLHVVEERELNNQRLTVDVDSIKNAIDQSGHVSLEGLLFKYDSDQLLPESLPVLAQIAEYLKLNTAQKFYVIGHTDDTGARSYNHVLSTNRAKQIVELLVDNYSIDKKRLTFDGVGEYSPLASNFNENDKKLNRRVELVLRTDNQ